MSTENGWMPQPPQEFVDTKRRKRMASVDALPADIRELVHDYGFEVVDQFMNCGVTKARHIRHLVERVLDAFSPTRGSFSRQGIRTEVVPPPPSTDTVG